MNEPTLSVVYLKGRSLLPTVAQTRSVSFSLTSTRKSVCWVKDGATRAGFETSPQV